MVVSTNQSKYLETFKLLNIITILLLSSNLPFHLLWHYNCRFKVPPINYAWLHFIVLHNLSVLGLRHE